MKPLRLILFLILIPAISFAGDIKVTGMGTAQDVSSAKTEAFKNARLQLSKEIQKIILTWTGLCYSGKDFNFEQISNEISLLGSGTYITKEKIRRNKKRKITNYTVYVTLSIGTSDKNTTEYILDSFQREMNPYNLKRIDYNRDEAYKSLYKVISRW